MFFIVINYWSFAVYSGKRGQEATGSLPSVGRFYLTDSVNNTYFIVTGVEMHTDDQGVPGKCLSVCVSEVRLPLRATFFSKEVVCL